ncbi:MAG: aminotransferase class I/II-fold pyridoxal phosphate-dependent enzyme, partial [Acidimicrobiia bacterium]|nr:aminotransferase class I/II-fold pyridoxal phosphate-dependent enzyme [Acidimicrobiia bacterium]
MADRLLVEPTLERLRTRTSAKWRKYEPDVVPVWVADMDYAPAPAVCDVLAAHADVGDLGYASAVDDDAYRDALVDWLRQQHQWTVPLEHTHTLVDVLQGMAAAVAVHTEPGDGIVLQTPAYPPMFDIIETAGRRVIDNPMTTDHRLDIELLSRQAADARALLLCNPHNPTGRVFSEHELAAMVHIAADHDLIIISDEIHADLVHPGHRHRPIAALDGAPER